MSTELTRPLPSPIKEDPPPPRIVRALRAFEEAVGGRDTLVAELAPVELGAEESLVLRLLADPDNDKKPLHEVLGHAGVSVARFLRIFRDARGARAYLAALDQVWEKLPDVAADVMGRALPKEVFCKPCSGTGLQKLEVGHRAKSGPRKKQAPPVVCPECAGEGKQPVEPTLEYQRLALTLGGMPKQTPGVLIDQSRKQANTFIGSDTLKDFVSAVSRIKRTPIATEEEPLVEEPLDVEATVVDDDSEDSDSL